jgi:uncharacterized protein (DUF488 family)
MSSRPPGPGSTPITIVSIGYAGRDPVDFVDVLRAHHVDLLVDVRLNAISRQRGFSKRALAAALAAADIDYRHTPELGNPKENRDAFHSGRADEARAIYLAHLNGDSRGTYGEIIELAHHRRIALLCVERDDEQCHRRAITDQAQAEEPAVSILRV